MVGNGRPIFGASMARGAYDDSWNKCKDRSVPFAPSSGRDQIIVLGRLEDGGGLRVRAARRRDAWEGTLCRVANASFSEFMLLGCPISMAMVMVIWQGDKSGRERRIPESLGVNGSFSSVTPPGPDVLLLCLAFLRCIRLRVTGAAAAPVFFVAAAVALSASTRSPVVTSSRLAGLAAIADPIAAPFCSSRPHRPFLFSLSYFSVWGLV